MNKYILYVFTAMIMLYIFVQWKYYYTRTYPFHIFSQIEYNKYDTVEIQKEDFVVLVLGGSTNFSVNVPFEENYPNQLEMLLKQKYPNKNFIFINGGMDWYTSQNSLINYSIYYNKFKPDITIIMHAINDICRSFSPKDLSLGSFKFDYSHFYGPASNAAKPPSLEKFLIKKALGDYSYQKYFFNLKETNIPIEVFKSYPSYIQNLKTLINYCKADNSHCIIVEQASLYKEKMNKEEQNALWFGRSLCNNQGNEYPNYQSLLIAMSKFNNGADSLSKYHEIPYVYTNKIIPKSLLYFKDDIHLKKNGTELFAKIVFEYLISDSTFITKLEK